MKAIVAIGAAIALLGAATMPALATPPECNVVTSHVSDAATPPVCLVADTKEKHPTWYRDGGYCEGGAMTTNVTGFSTEEGCEPI